MPGLEASRPADRLAGARRVWTWLRQRWVRRGASLLVFIAALEYLVLPQIAGTRNALHVVGNVRPEWLVLGLALEVTSLLSYSLLTRSVLPDERPSYWWLFRTDITALGLGHIVPGGTATATPLRYRLLRDGGTSAKDAIVGATVEGVGSTLVLVVILWVSLVTSIITIDIRTSYIVASALGAALIAAAALAITGLSRGALRASAVVDRLVRVVPAAWRERVRHALDTAAAQTGQILTNRQELRRSALWAAGSWLLDAASLWVFLTAYGWHANPAALLVAYGTANLVAVVPISPGGLGVIEGVLIPSLVGFGAPGAVATLGVVSWRLFNFWAPIPSAGLCFLSLRAQTWHEHLNYAGLRHAFSALFAERRPTTSEDV